MPTIPYDATVEALLHPERRATILVHGPAPSRMALAIEAARLAYVRAEDDDSARAHLANVLALAGFGAPTTFDDPASDSQGFAALRPSDGLALAAFRGTQADKARDVLTDLMAWKVASAPWPGEVHAGFARAATALLRHVDAWLAGEGSTRMHLLLCGHSLGAAIATLVAMHVVRHPHGSAPAASSPSPAVQLVTIGSPRVGDAAFASAFAASGIVSTRIVDALDIVTRLPPVILGYEHVGTAEFIDEHGNVGTRPSHALADADGATDDLGVLATGAEGILPRSLSDHAPVNYLRAYWP